MGECDRGVMIDLARSAANCGVALAALHWLPWNRATGEELEPPVAYAVGMVPVLGYSLAWAARRRRLSWWGFVVGLLVHLGLGGAAVWATYQLDELWGERNMMRLGGEGYGSGARRRVV